MQSIDPAYTEESNEAGEILGSMMYVLNPAGNFDSFYTDHGESVPETYDVTELTQHVAAGDAQEYISSAQRAAYRSQRAQSGSAVFLAGNLTTAENEEKSSPSFPITVSPRKNTTASATTIPM